MRHTRTLTAVGARLAIIAVALACVAASTEAQGRRPVSDPMRFTSTVDVFKVGVSFDAAWFGNFNDLVASQPNLTTSKGDDLALGAGASLEFSPRRTRPFFARVGFNFGFQDFEQAYNSASPLDPTMATGRARGVFLDGQLGLRLFRSGTTIFDLVTGPTWARNDATIEFTYPTGPVEVSRIQDGWKWNGGAKLWRALDERTGLQIGVTYTNSFKGVDADQNWRLSTGITLGFGAEGSD